MADVIFEWLVDSNIHHLQLGSVTRRNNLQLCIKTCNNGSNSTRQMDHKVVQCKHLGTSNGSSMQSPDCAQPALHLLFIHPSTVLCSVQNSWMVPVLHGIVQFTNNVTSRSVLALEVYLQSELIAVHVSTKHGCAMLQRIWLQNCYRSPSMISNSVFERWQKEHIHFISIRNCPVILNAKHLLLSHDALHKVIDCSITATVLLGLVDLLTPGHSMTIHEPLDTEVTSSRGYFLDIFFINMSPMCHQKPHHDNLVLWTSLLVMIKQFLLNDGAKQRLFVPIQTVRLVFSWINSSFTQFSSFPWLQSQFLSMDFGVPRVVDAKAMIPFKDRALSTKLSFLQRVCTQRTVFGTCEPSWQ